mgnify:CR=1 FL=1
MSTFILSQVGDHVLVDMEYDSTDIEHRRYLRGRVRKMPENETHDSNFIKVGLLTEPEYMVGQLQ